MRTVGRILLVPFAMLAAALTTAAVIIMLGQERIVQAMAGRASEDAVINAALDIVNLAVGLASVQTLLPPLLLVIVGEVARLRSALYYVVGGGIAIAIIPLIASLAMPLVATAGLNPVVWQVLATAGFAGGFVYWLLAGRTA
ncbi:MAG: hypothetical protein NW223_07705 [Hyphomicrobiaceae bacterium]|nr:hypothetical protein [Hyphomicrobiaceae bacterium]